MLKLSPARRNGETPVYRLHCDTLKIETVATSGDKPGWIYEHKAIYSKDSQTETIRITGGKVIHGSGDEEEYLVGWVFSDKITCELAKSKMRLFVVMEINS